MLIRFGESYCLWSSCGSSIFSGPPFRHRTLLLGTFLPPTTTSTTKLQSATTTSLPAATERMADDSSDLSSISSLSPAPSGDESEIELKPQNGILKFFHRVSKDDVAEARKKEMSPPPRKREPSPPHEYIFADNPDIAVSREADLSRHICEKTRKCAVALPQPWLTNLAVHCHVPQAIRQCYAQVSGTFRPSRAGAGHSARPSCRASRTISLCRSGPPSESQARHQVRGSPTLPHQTRARLTLAFRIGHYHKALNEDAINGKDFKPQWPREWEDRSPLAGGATFQTISPKQRVSGTPYHPSFLVTILMA